MVRRASSRGPRCDHARVAARRTVRAHPRMTGRGPRRQCPTVCVDGIPTCGEQGLRNLKEHLSAPTRRMPLTSWTRPGAFDNGTDGTRSKQGLRMTPPTRNRYSTRAARLIPLGTRRLMRFSPPSEVEPRLKDPDDCRYRQRSRRGEHPCDADGNPAVPGH